MAQGVPAFQPEPFGSAEETQKYPTVIPAAGGAGGFQAAAEQPAGVPAFMSLPEAPGGEAPAPFFTAAPEAGQEQGIALGQPSDAVVIPGFGGELGEPPSPADIFATGTQTPIPLTAQSPAGQPDMPANLWTNSPQVTEIPAARPFDELFATHPTPVPTALQSAPESTAPEAKPKKKFQSKGFLVVLGSSVGVLALVAFFFLHNPRDIVQMFNMGPQKKGHPAAEAAAAAGQQPRPAGQQAAGAAQGQPAQAAQAQSAQSQAPNRTLFPQPETPSVAAAGQARPAPAQDAKPQAPSRDFIPNENIRAVEFVKDYRLDKEHGTISQWLQYSFQSTAENTANWSAGAISSTIYVVTYRVSYRGKLKYTYNFEVDLAQKTIVGKNPEAVSLLNSGKPVSAKPQSAPQRRPQARASKSPKPAVKAQQAEDEPSPLPDESELETGGRQGGSRFNNPGADTVTLSP